MTIANACYLRPKNPFPCYFAWRHYFQDSSSAENIICVDHWAHAVPIQKLPLLRDTSPRTCRSCDQLKYFAKKACFRTVDLRSAIRSRHIDGSHVLSEDAFIQDMRAYVRGDTGMEAKKVLQAGARTERMSKRNRV